MLFMLFYEKYQHERNHLDYGTVFLLLNFTVLTSGFQNDIDLLLAFGIFVPFNFP